MKLLRVSVKVSLGDLGVLSHNFLVVRYSVKIIVECPAIS